jgi:hypothetical protein
MQNRTQQRIVDLDMPVIADEAQLAKLVQDRREHFRDWLLVSPTKEPQNESYLEAVVRTERCNAVAWQRGVGERHGRLALPTQGRVGITGRQIGPASSEPFLRMVNITHSRY